jgi:hypothetical protein
MSDSPCRRVGKVRADETLRLKWKDDEIGRASGEALGQAFKAPFGHLI